MEWCARNKNFLPFGVLLVVTLLSATILSSSISSADTEKQSDTTVTVGSACTMFRESTVPHVVSVGPSSYREDVGTTRLKTVCNDTNGYAIYAIGYSNDTDGDTNMYGEEHGLTIPTGTESGDVSNWSMKIGKDANSYNAANLTITPSFTSYTNIPSTQTKIASFEGATDSVEGSVVTTTYAIRVSSSQLADTYEGKVKYAMVHPADGTAPDEPEPIYAQDITAETCPTTPTTMVDSRDGEKYIIRKLPDGNCWMLENLRLDPATLKTTLTSENTNLAPGTTYTLPDATTSGFSYDSAGTPRLFAATKNSTMYNGWDSSSKMGVYYNICAASAGTACDGTDAEYDICPAGWRLPIGGYGEDSEHYALYQTFGLLEPFVAAVRPTRTGQFHNNGLQNTGSYGYFWSSKSAGNGETYALITDAQASFYGKDNHYGLSVRCIAAPSASAKTYIQDVTTDTCPTTPTTVYDIRDEEAYTIQKLADGNCWLLDNLRLDIANSTVQDELTPETTNASDVTLGYLKNGGGTASDQYAIDAAANWTGNYHSYSTPLINTTYKDTTGSGGYEAGKYGIYYNYCAASAGSYCYGNGTSVGTTSSNATEDICPKGWRMPTGRLAGEYKALYDAYNSDYSDFVNALRTPLAGDFYDGSASLQGAIGYFWSSTYDNNDDSTMYDMLVSTSNVGPQLVYDRLYGFSVRCIAKESEPEPDPTRIYIQDVDKSTCPTTPTTVYDIRDNEAYTIQKLADGNCWLLDNLRLDPVSTSLSSLKGNTNASDTTLEYLKGISTGTSLDRYAESGVMEYDGTKVEPEIYNGPTVYTGDKNSLSVYGYGENRVGVLYNYCAASAGGYCYDSYSGENDATEDICPAGWRLPTGGEGGEYEVLYQAYESDLNNFRDALRTVPSGFISDDHSLSNNGSRTTGAVGFWTSTYDDIATMKTLYTTIPYLISPRSQYARNYSFSIRCIAKESEKTYIQDITLESCPTTPTTVYDRRDNEEYTIQKLADGNCWLLDNLRLDPTTLKTTLTIENTNMDPSTPFTLPGSTSSNFFSYTEPRINTDSKNTIQTYGDGSGKSGVFYNYCAATAGTYCYAEYEGTGSAKYDICPKGWRLPTGGENGEYEALFTLLGEDKILYKNTLRMALSGNYGENAIMSAGSFTTIWSATNEDSSRMHNIGASSSDVYLGGYTNRFLGYSVRCIAYNGIEPEPLHDIQNVTPSTCPTTPTTVYDTRDGQVYTIQKLADGKCWMLDNLRLGRSTVKVLTPDDTNIRSNFTLPGSVSTGFDEFTTPQINIDSRSDTTSYGDGENKIGVYYNFCAATAGTYCQPQNQSSGTPTEDICPKGWRLPTGGENGEYQNLYAQYNTYADFKNALHASLSGYFKYAQTNHQGSYGSFWSSTPVGDDRMYSLDVRATSVPNDFTSYRTAGISIRCVAYEPTETYIQDITPDNCPANPTTVYDTRDNSAYTIQKLADGNCWMLDNLRIGRSTMKVLTPADTNITSNFTLPGSVSTGFDEFELPQINIDSKNKVTSYGAGDNKIGVYYNFCAASAGTYCYAQGEAEGSATEDICPKGWRIPTGGEEGEYQNLYSQYNSYADFKNALRASLSGYFKYAQTNHQGSYGSFWSSTPVGDDRMYSLDVRATSVPNDFTSYRTAGISIRCVAKKSPITYIQDVTADICPTTPTVVYDKRDGEEYTIQKLADGKCWMLDHLRLDPATLIEPLTSANTNIASGRTYTLPSSVSSGFNNYSAAQINTSRKDTLVNYGTGTNQAKAGVYYNFCAATAGTVCYSGASASQDICPAGWRLPTGGSSGEYQALYSAYGSNPQIFSDALHMAYSGTYWGNNNGDLGVKGRSWSSTSRFSGNSYNLCHEIKNGGYVTTPSDTNGQDVGMGVRCVAK